MHSFRDRFFRFMEGATALRGLQDGLQIVIYAVYLLLVIINFFARSRIVNGLELLLIAYMLFRILSKNIPARENEGRRVSEFLYKTHGTHFVFGRQTHKTEAAEKPFKKNVKRTRNTFTVNVPRAARRFACRAKKANTAYCARAAATNSLSNAADKNNRYTYSLKSTGVLLCRVFNLLRPAPKWNSRRRCVYKRR